MEDQPADPGDLTTGDQAGEQAGRRRWWRRRPKAAAAEPESRPEEPAAEVKKPVGKRRRTARTQAEPQAETPQSEQEQPEQEQAGQESTAEDAPAEEQVDPATLVAHRPAGRSLLAAMLVCAALFVGAAGFAGANLWPYVAKRAEVDTKLQIARTAATAIATLWTYTPENMEQLPDRAEGYLGGDFAYEYRKYIDAIVASNKQAQVTNTTQVLGAAVETLAPTEATAIVYTNSVATSPLTKNIPSLRYLSYRLTLQRDGSKWLITRMSTITSLDLTPQL